MKLRYETGIATLIQLAAVMFFIVANNVANLINDCFVQDRGCVEPAFVSIVIIFFTGLWFVFLSVIGFAAQDKRSHKLAKLLIAGEVFTALIALALLRYPGTVFVALSAIITIAAAVWISILAYRLSKAKGGRIVQRPRRRLHDDS